MDFITCLPPSSGKSTIMVVVDRLSKYAHFSALPSHYTGHKVAEIFIADIVRLHGVPRTIVSDRDPIFIGSFWQNLFKLQGTTLSTSTAYHPQTDGQTEVLNRCLEMYLRAFVCDEPKLWTRFLPWAEYWYNTSFHTASGTTPYEALYGRPPPTMSRFIPGTTTNEAVETALLQRDAIIGNLKTHLLRAQNRMKIQADKHRVDRHFAIGDWVFVKLQPYRQHSVAIRRNQKLGRRYFGPFQVLEKLGQVAYRLALPATAKIHPVFHVSLLKRCIGEPEGQVIPLPLLATSAPDVVQPLVVLANREIKRQGTWVPQALVQWEGLPPEEATWVDTSQLQQQIPNLEDKVLSDAVGNDTTRPEIQTEPDIQAGHDPNKDSISTVDQAVIRKGSRLRMKTKTLKDYICIIGNKEL